MTRPDSVDDADKVGLDALLAASPELAAVAASVRAFAAIMNERRGRRLLEPWMTAAPRHRRARAEILRHRAARRSGRHRQRAQPALELRCRRRHVNRIKMLNDKCTDARNPTYSAASSLPTTHLERSRNCARTIIGPSSRQHPILAGQSAVRI
jgi:hypothetical protein